MLPAALRHATISPGGELFFNQISDRMSAEPRQLPKRSLAGDCASSAIGGPSGLPALSPAERTAAPIPWAATGSLSRECHGCATALRGKGIAHASRRVSAAQLLMTAE